MSSSFQGSRRDVLGPVHRPAAEGGPERPDSGVLDSHAQRQHIRQVPQRVRGSCRTVRVPRPRKRRRAVPPSRRNRVSEALQSCGLQ